MTRNVIAIVGENANSILERQSRRFMDRLAPQGLVGHVLSVHASDFESTLALILSGGVSFAWGYAGVGSRLTIDGRNLWQATGVPFVSALFDPPYMMPRNHDVASDYVVNAYAYRDWLDIQRTTVRSAQVSALLPTSVLPNPDARAPWRQRGRRMVFVKSGGDPVAQRNRWHRWPATLCAVLNDCADSLATKGTGPICPDVDSVLRAHSLVLDGAKPLLFGLLHELDTYLRNLRGTAIATALLPLPVDIVGSGWGHINCDEGRARVHPPIDAGALEALYADTQILVNANPNFATGTHERVLRGFASRCRIVSDNNDHARQHLLALPSYAGVEWNDPDLADRLAEIFHDDTPFDDRLDAAQAYVEAKHPPDALVDGMRRLADIVRLTRTMACYGLEAA